MENKQTTKIRSLHRVAGEAKGNPMLTQSVSSKTEERVTSSDKKNDTNWPFSCNNEPTIQCTNKKSALQGLHEDSKGIIVKAEARGSDGSSFQGECGRERIKRHRAEVAGRVGIPDVWGQEELLKDWIDCSVFDACLVSSKIVSARTALVQEGRRDNARGLRITNRC